MTLRTQIGARFRAFRIHVHQSQCDLAGTLGLHPPAVSLIERGGQRLSDENLTILVQRFRLNVQWLLTGTGDMVLAPGDIAARREEAGPAEPDQLVARFREAMEEALEGWEGAVAMQRTPVVVALPPGMTRAAYERERGKIEGVRAELVALPILEGAIAAGPARAVQEGEVSDWALCLRGHIPHPGETTCVRVQGESMLPEIPDGALVGVDHRAREPGAIARGREPFAAVRDRTDPDLCLIRRVKATAQGFYFYPGNPAPEHTAWEWKPDDGDCPVIGRVVFIYRACQ